MDHNSPLNDSDSWPAFLGEGGWRQLEDMAQAAAPWQLLLVDEQGHAVQHAPTDAPTDGHPPVVEPLRDAQAQGVFTEALRQGQATLLISPQADTDHLWQIVPITKAGQASGALLLGGAPRPGQPLEDQAAALRQMGHFLTRVTSAVTSLQVRTDPPDETFQARYLAQLERSAALQQLSTLLLTSREMETIAGMVLQETCRLFAADRAAIYLRQPDQSLRCSAAIGLSPEYIDAVNRLYTQAAGGRAAATLDIVYVADAQADPVMGPLRVMAQAEGYRSMIVVPFVNRGEGIGALTLYHDQHHEYSPDDSTALLTFANEVAIALDNARLFGDAQRQLARLTFLAEAGRMLNTSLELDQVFAVVARAAAHVIGGGCGLYLIQADDPALELQIYYDEAPLIQERRRVYLETHSPTLGADLIGQVAMGGATRLVTIDGLGSENDPYLRPMDSQAYLAVPLRVQDRIIGVLVLWLFDPHRPFSDDDTTLAEALADRAAVALDNARLYERERLAQRAKDEFLSSVSHELRTPLTAIMGYTQLVRKRLGDAPEVASLRQQLQVVTNQADRLHRLIETILDISRIEQGQLELQLDRLHLGDVLLTTVERIQATTRPTLHFDIAVARGGCLVRGDRIRLEQVFANLLNNAVKYSPPEGVVRVCLQQVGAEVQVEISDQGPGLGMADADQLFERYYKADTPRNRAGGLGLGLYISRAIVEQHGGTITARTAPGGGALFYVNFPCAGEQANNVRGIPMNTLTSQDGTPLAFDRLGTGPALILVTGAMATRSDAASLAASLAPHFTVFAYDRRGRGDSGDTPPYAVEREIEDLAAVIAAAGGSACVFGHSSGAILALEAAHVLGPAIPKLALYEPPFIVDDSTPPLPADYVTRLTELAAAGRRGDMVTYWMTTIIGVPPDQVAQMQKAPMWAGMEAVAPTLVYDATISAPYVRSQPLPPHRWAAVTMPTLVMDGGASPAMMHSGAEALTAILPNAQHRRFPGQGHGVADEVLVPVLVEFFKAGE